MSLNIKVTTERLTDSESAYNFKKYKNIWRQMT